MRLRVLIAAALCCLVSFPSHSAETIAASLSAAPASADQLMARFGLEGLFSRFGHSIAASPRLHGIADERFLGAWEGAAVTTFDSPDLDNRLGAAISAALDGADLSQLEAFVASPLGQRVGALEQATQDVPPTAQIAVVAKGQTLYLAASEQRRAQFRELLDLTGSDITFDMLAESLRGMAMGLRLASAGDVEVAWDEVDADVARQLTGMKQSLADSAGAVLAYTYQSLSDDELESYLAFLRAPSTRKFYAAATLTIGDILREAMFGLGEAVAQRMNRVEV